MPMINKLAVQPILKGLGVVSYKDNLPIKSNLNPCGSPKNLLINDFGHKNQWEVIYFLHVINAAVIRSDVFYIILHTLFSFMISHAKVRIIIAKIWQRCKKVALLF